MWGKAQKVPAMQLIQYWNESSVGTHPDATKSVSHTISYKSVGHKSVGHKPVDYKPVDYKPVL
jgi:hypothetical protein